MVTIKFDPTNTVSYPSYKCPVCDSDFYGSGRALHMDSCTEKGYQNCHVMVGPKMISVAKERAGKGQGNEPMPLCGLTPFQIKEQLPDQWAALPA